MLHNIWNNTTFCQQKLSVNIGGQYLVNTLDLTVDYSGILLNIGGEYKLSRILTTAIDLGVLGNENSGNDNIRFTSLSLDPVRVYFSEAMSGAFVAPRALLTTASDESGDSIIQFSPGIALGFSYLSLIHI